MLRSDVVTARAALRKILAGRVLFTTVFCADGGATIIRPTASGASTSVPDGISHVCAPSYQVTRLNPALRGPQASTHRSAKRLAPAIFGALILALAAWPARRAAADDETANTEIQIKAPLTATNCAATPPTITVLGLEIDVSNATFDSGNDEGENDDDGTQTSSGGCAALVVGDNVEVKFASDATPLAATQVDDQGSEDQEVSIEGPLQAVDTTLSTVQILGLTINVGSASLDGAGDDSEDGNSQPIDLTQLIVGQFVDEKLDASQLPALVATELEVQNFDNQVEVEVDDQNGNEIDDASDDVQVDVKETVSVQAPTGTGT
jgi:hypothetical protein